MASSPDPVYRTQRAPTWRVLPFLSAILLVPACNDGEDPIAPVEGPEPPAVATPAAIAIVSGNGQEAKANVGLTEPLIVRVTDEQGNGIASVPVAWTITSGSADTWFSDTDCCFTDRNGLTRINVVPRSVGTTTVSASVHGFQNLSVTFMLQARDLVIWVSSSRNQWVGFGIDPGDVTVPVGTTIEWWSEQSYSVTSTAVPPGGESFASGVLGSSEHFQFVPTLAGTWEYRVREHDASVPNGGAEGAGTITVE